MKTTLGILVALVCAGLHAQAPFERNYYTTNAAPAGSINWVDVSTNSYTFGDVGIGTTPITAQKMTLRVDDLRTTPINGFFLTNATPATAGVQVQDSPSSYWSGGAWLTGSLSNAPVVFRSYVVPVAGATTPTGNLIIGASFNNGAFSTAFTLDGAGNITIPGSVALSFANATAAYIIQGKSRLVSSVNGAFEMQNNSANAISTVQANFPQVTKTANYPIVALDSGLQFDNIGASATNRLDLPVAVAKMRYLGYVDAAFRMQFQAQGADVIRDGSAVSGAAAGIWADAPGECIELFSPKSGVWVVRSKNGSWTIE